MRNILFASTAVVMLASAGSAFATDAGPCGPAATSCSISEQTMGDTIQTTDAANHGASQATNLGNSSAGNNASGSAETNIGDTQVSTGAATTTGGAINTDLNAIGNNANGGAGGMGGQGFGGTGGAGGSVGNTTTGDSTSSANNNINAGGNVNSSGAGTVDSSGSGNVTGGQVGDTGVVAGNGSGNVRNDSDNLNLNAADQSTRNNADNSTKNNANNSDNNANLGLNLQAQGQATDVKNANKNGDVSGTQLQGQATEVKNGSSSSSGSNSGGNTLSNGSNSGGNKLAATTGTQANTNASKGNVTNVDAADRSTTNYKSIFIPAVVPVTPPSTVAIGNIIKETTACGPLQAVVKTPITGTYNGLIRQSTIQQGYTYDLAPYTDEAGVMQTSMSIIGADGVRRVYGHQAIIFSTVLGVSGNRNIALGGGGNEGAWGQGGMGSSSSNTQLVTNIQLKLCELGAYKEVPVLVEVEKKDGGQ